MRSRYRKGTRVLVKLSSDSIYRPGVYATYMDLDDGFPHMVFVRVNPYDRKKYWQLMDLSDAEIIRRD